MSEIVSIQVTGLEEIKRRLDELQDGKLARSMMRTGSREAAKVLLAAQKETVPVGDTGELLNSLGIQVKGANTDKLQILVGADREWNFIGRFHEFGTKKMAGSHWTQKAWDASCNEALNAFTNTVRKMLDKRMWSELKAGIEEGLSMGGDE